MIIRISVLLPEVFFSHISSDGALDPSFARPIEVLVPLTKTFLDAIFHFGVFDMVTGSRFDAGRNMLFLEQLREVESVTVTGESESFWLYNFETGKVYPVPSLTQRG